MLIALILAVSPSGGVCDHWADDFSAMAQEQRLVRIDTGRQYLNPFRACELAAAALIAAGRNPAGSTVGWDGAMQNVRFLLSYAWGESRFWVAQRNGAGHGWRPGWNVARGLFSIGTQWGQDRYADAQVDSAAWSMLWGAVNLDCLEKNPQRRCAGSETGYGHGLIAWWPRPEFAQE